ncbi:MAG: F420-0--gamma-glutamyl ligase [Clostridiaceae bacterium]|nr:F420-0--gamma-glutamyl ligase [Clostridiaceae bacterium]
MKRYIGTVARGVRTPIFDEGDDLAIMLPEIILKASETENFALRDKDVLAITESIVARAQGNYADIHDIEKDLRKKLDGVEEIGLVLPILSRNRFSILLKGIANAVKRVYLQLSFPADEVGNQLFDPNLLLTTTINPYTDVLNEEQFYNNFGKSEHPFTGVNYIQLYRDIVEEAGAECTIIFANDCSKILDYTKYVIACDVHTRKTSVEKLKKAGAEFVLDLTHLLNEPTKAHGYNEQYGLLGSNKADETTIKLFPRDCQKLTEQIAQRLFELSGKKIEVMIYGDGAFKDPVGKIWELADPVVSPAYTSGLKGTPNELKIKYLADSDYKDLSAEEKQAEITKRIVEKDNSDIQSQDENIFEGTTPRNLTDLLGSLADLVSGSGDKGTPIVYIQGYFDNFSDGY